MPLQQRAPEGGGLAGSPRGTGSLILGEDLTGKQPERYGKPWASASEIELAYGLKLIHALKTGGAYVAVPLVATALTPAIEPGLPDGVLGEGAEVPRFAHDAVLITTLESSFHWITLESSHRVVPS